MKVILDAISLLFWPNDRNIILGDEIYLKNNLKTEAATGATKISGTNMKVPRVLEYKVQKKNDIFFKTQI